MRLILSVLGYLGKRQLGVWRWFLGMSKNKLGVPGFMPILE